MFWGDMELGGQGRGVWKELEEQIGSKHTVRNLEFSKLYYSRGREVLPMTSKV